MFQPPLSGLCFVLEDTLKIIIIICHAGVFINKYHFHPNLILKSQVLFQLKGMTVQLPLQQHLLPALAPVFAVPGKPDNTALVQTEVWEKR